MNTMTRIHKMFIQYVGWLVGWLSVHKISVDKSKQPNQQQQQPPQFVPSISFISKLISKSWTGHFVPVDQWLFISEMNENCHWFGSPPSSTKLVFYFNEQWKISTEKTCVRLLFIGHAWIVGGTRISCTTQFNVYIGALFYKTLSRD